jgi:endonuclease/exonuclease/phosphatase (EEP) superfamily protein YafD
VAVVVGTAAALALGELGRLDWRLELLSHFAVQYVFALALASAYLLIRRRRLWFGIAILAALVPAWRLSAYLPIRTAVTHATSDAYRLRVMTFNVHAKNDRYAAALAEIERFDSDIVFLPEATDRWAAGLAPLRAKYPYIIDDRSPTVFSILLFSRVPLSGIKVIPLPGGSRARAVVATTCMDGGNDVAACIRLIGIHPPPPMIERWATERDAALRALPELIVRRDEDRTILLGDFNCTPWSPMFRDLIAATDMRDAALGFGLAPTWLSRWLPFGLTIDHILVGSAIEIDSHQVGRAVGSDHFAVVADLRF